MIKCTRCDLTKPDEEFSLSNGKRKKWCKSCLAEKAREYYKNTTTEQREKKRKRNQYYRKSNRKKTMLALARQRANRKGIEFSINEMDINIPEYCPVLDIKLAHNAYILRGDSPTIDRIDPTLGYVPENCKVISWRANRIKSDATLEEIEAIIEYLEAAT